MRGIIPAYAGSTMASMSYSPTLPDHPRIRGEHQPGFHRARSSSGSSPHTRGAPSLLEHGIDSRRIIPAYAGSTAFPAAWKRGVRDHPRIRGEHQRCTDCTQGAPGSSPHTRGAPTLTIPDSVTERIIPAYAGSTGRREAVDVLEADHPRIRGEHDTPRIPGSASGGSSPHTRGALLARLSQIFTCRIIPAYAGSTRSWSCRPP